jgi:hypothetical protein
LLWEDNKNNGTGRKTDFTSPELPKASGWSLDDIYDRKPSGIGSASASYILWADTSPFTRRAVSSAWIHEHVGEQKW